MVACGIGRDGSNDRNSAAFPRIDRPRGESVVRLTNQALLEHALQFPLVGTRPKNGQDALRSSESFAVRRQVVSGGYSRAHAVGAKRACESKDILNAGETTVGVFLARNPGQRQGCRVAMLFNSIQLDGLALFPVRAGSPMFEPIAARYPVFELIRIRRESSPESPDSNR